VKKENKKVLDKPSIKWYNKYIENKKQIKRKKEVMNYDKHKNHKERELRRA
jgi:hypothetical protein